MNLTLKPCKYKDYRFLYRLLKERNLKESISHKKMPTYEEHKTFNMIAPYDINRIIYRGHKKIGRLYITFHNEIGIHFIKSEDTPENKKEILKQVVSEKKLYANISPQNKTLQKILKELGFKIIQYTYASIY